MVICSRRSSTTFSCLLRLQADRDERLLARLCDLGRRLDPMPDTVIAAARSAGCAHVSKPETRRASSMSEHAYGVANGQDQVQKPLTLVMPIKPDIDVQTLGVALASQDLRNRIEAKLRKLNTVHFARFVVLDGEPRRLAVITSYDDEFDDYIMSFTDELGEIFDMLLEFVDEPPARPVKQHREEFLAYVQAHDLKCVGPFFSAYPQQRVADIVSVASSAG
jgi:hypothetical protein